MLLTICAVAGIHAPAPAPSDVLAKVNGVPVSAEGLGFLLYAMKKAKLPLTVSGFKRACVDVELLRQAAVARGIDKTAAARGLSQSIQEDALVQFCRENLQEATPSFPPEEVKAIWNVLRASALTQYEFDWFTYKTVEDAKADKSARWKRNPWLAAIPRRWGTKEDPDLPPFERHLLDQAIPVGGPCESDPFSRDGKVHVFQLTGNTRTVDPFLRNPLNTYVLEGEPGEKEFSVTKTLLPEWHLWRTLEALRAKAGLPPAPTLGTALTLAQHHALAAEHRMLLLKEARQRGMDARPPAADGLKHLHAWALGVALIQADLEAHPPTDADLRNALLQKTRQCISLRYEAVPFPTAAAAKAALPGFQKVAPPQTLPWVKAESLPDGLLDSLQWLEPGKWLEDPVRNPEGGFNLIRLVDRRPEPGFDALLARRREELLHQLRLERRYQMIRTLRAAARIE